MNSKKSTARKGKIQVAREITAALASIVTDFKNENDRSAVIVGAAKLDAALQKLLQNVLLASPTSSDELFDGDTPLATFSAKIHLAYRLGFIDSDFARALHLVRKIRNSFAHEVATKTLSEGAHKDRVDVLAAPFRRFHQFESNREKLKADKASTESIDFRAVQYLMIARLEFLARTAEPFDSSVSMSLVPVGWTPLSSEEE